MSEQDYEAHQEARGAAVAPEPVELLAQLSCVPVSFMKVVVGR